jgi:hypothetical protein
MFGKHTFMFGKHALMFGKNTLMFGKHALMFGKKWHTFGTARQSYLLYMYAPYPMAWILSESLMTLIKCVISVIIKSGKSVILTFTHK